MSQRRRIIFAWEWGAGAGHLARFAPIAARLDADGLDTVIVTRDLRHAASYFSERCFTLVQAPVSHQQSSDRVQDPRTFAELAWNLAIHEATLSRGLISAWVKIFEQWKPDVLISDFGICAGAVAAALGIPQIRMGTSFDCPPKTEPLSQLRFPTQRTIVEDRPIDTDVLKFINAGLETNCLRNLDTLADTLPPAHRTLLATFPEFDHYHRHSNASPYVGIWDHPIRRTVGWRGIGRRRAIAYLKPFPALPELMRSATALGIEIALISDGIPSKMLHECQSAFVSVQQGHVDLTRLGGQCDFAITNANHGCTLRFLMQRVPVLAVPLFVEHKLNALRLEESRLGISISPRDTVSPGALNAALQQLESLRMNFPQFIERNACRTDKSEATYDIIRRLLDE